jgi:hypothetical protein
VSSAVKTRAAAGAVSRRRQSVSCLAAGHWAARGGRTFQLGRLDQCSELRNHPSLLLHPPVAVRLALVSGAEADGGLGEEERGDLVEEHGRAHAELA